MAVSMQRRLLHGVGANMFAQIVFVAVQLIGVPVLLRTWGTHLYGEWLILSAIPSYLAISDLGFSQSAANDMTQMAARGEHREALTVFQSLCALIFSCAGIGLILALPLIFLLPFDHWWHASTLGAWGARLVLLFLVLETLIRLISGANDAGFRACGDYALNTMIYIATYLFQNVSIWVMALAGLSPVYAAAAMLFIRFISTPATALLLIMRHRWLSFGIENARASELRRLSKPALANLGIPLAQAINIQGMVLVVGFMLGPVAVVTFSTLRTLTRLVQQLVNAIYNAIEPELAAAYGMADHLLIQRIFIHALRAGLWLALSACTVLLVFGGFIVKTWTHGRVLMDPLLFDWFLACAVACSIWYACLAPIRAANGHLRLATVFCLSAAAAIGLAAVLLSFTKRVSDAGMALLFMDGSMAVYCLHLVSRDLNISVRDCLVQAADPRAIFSLVLRKLRIA